MATRSSLQSARHRFLPHTSHSHTPAFLSASASATTAAANAPDGSRAKATQRQQQSQGAAATQHARGSAAETLGRLPSLTNKIAGSPSTIVKINSSSSAAHAPRTKKHGDESGVTVTKGPLKWLKNRFARESREQRYKQSHAHILYNEKTKPFSIARDGNGGAANDKQVHVKGLGLAPHMRLKHHAVSLVKSILELLAFVLLLAIAATITLSLGMGARVRVDGESSSHQGSSSSSSTSSTCSQFAFSPDHQGGGLGQHTEACSGVRERASLTQCFMVVLSLLLTSSDDWSPVRLDMAPAVYICVMVRHQCV